MIVSQSGDPRWMVLLLHNMVVDCRLLNPGFLLIRVRVLVAETDIGTTVLGMVRCTGGEDVCIYCWF